MTATPWVDGPHRFNICYAVHGLQETRDCTKTTFNPHNFLCFHLKFIRIGVCCIFNVFVLNSVCTFKRIIHFYSPFFCLNARLFLVFGKISINHSSDLEIENHEIYERKHQSRLRYRSYFSEFSLQNGNRISIGVHRVFLVAPISLFLNCWLKSVKKISKSLL